MMLVTEVINMKETIIKEIEQKLLRYLDNAQMEMLHRTLKSCLDNVTFIMQEDSIQDIFEYSNMELIDKFIASKEIEGCSKRTTQYYKSTLVMLENRTDIHFTHMTTDHLRTYLTDYQKINNCSKVSIDNIRRNLSSFFSWLEEENYILKSPMKRIHKIKTDKVIKETLSDESLECLRDSCDNLRDLAIIDLLASTGMRVGDDDDKIRLNQRKPSKYKGLSRFGPEKNLQRINKFMKERPTFYKKLIQMKENFRFYLRCFYCITKVVILQFNSEKQDRISS